MARKLCPVWVVGLLLLALASKSAVAQSLSIYREGPDDLWLRGNSPLNTAYRFQASVDYIQWTDISDPGAGAVTFRLDTKTNATGFYRLRTWPMLEETVTLAILGDSTVADYAIDENRFAGWGQGIYAQMKPHVRVVNLAVPNQSSLTFLHSMQKDNLVRLKPEFVLIEFGFVDTSPTPGFHTDLPEYEENLRSVVQMVRDFQGIPILVTPTGVRYFLPTGKVVPVLQDRCEVVRRVAGETHAYLVDLNLLAENLFNELGPEKTDTDIESHPGDSVHFSLTGADIIAGLVVKAYPGILRFHALSP